MTERLCSVEGCERKRRARGLCSMHYQRLKNTGSVELAVREPRVCSVDGCGAGHLARGLCCKHYNRLVNTGSVDLAVVEPRVCSVDGCERKRKGNGLCGMHYKRLRDTGSVGEAAPLTRSNPPKVCTVDGCERKHLAIGLCNLHYVRLRDTGSVGSPFMKPRYSCQVCDHPEVEEIDALLRNGGRGVALGYGFTWREINPHKRNHLDNEQYHARAAAEAVKILNEVRAAARA